MSVPLSALSVLLSLNFFCSLRREAGRFRHDPFFARLNRPFILHLKALPSSTAASTDSPSRVRRARTHVGFPRSHSRSAPTTQTLELLAHATCAKSRENSRQMSGMALIKPPRTNYVTAHERTREVNQPAVFLRGLQCPAHDLSRPTRLYTTVLISVSTVAVSVIIPFCKRLSHTYSVFAPKPARSKTSTATTQSRFSTSNTQST